MTNTLLMAGHGMGGASRLEMLVTAARTGDRGAMDQLLQTIERRVYVFAYRLTGHAAGAEDVAQEALLKVCRNLGGYRGEANFWGWIYRIVANQAHDYRQAADRGEVSEAGLEPAAGPDPARQEQLRRVMGAFRVLSQKEREALVLTDVEGFTSREAARILGCLPITVRTRAAQARKKVRRALARYYPELREDS